MQPCPGCRRHLLADEAACPFCGRALRSAGAPVGLAVVLGLALGGCGASARVQGDGPHTDGGDESAGGGTSGSAGDSVSSSGGACGAVGDSCASGCCSGLVCGYDDTCREEDWGDEGDSGCQFYAGCPVSDWLDEPFCDIWNPEDCPEGDKCTAYAIAGSSWDANKCVMVQGDGQPGDDCVATDGNAVSGNDDCAKGSLCWDIDPDTQTGYCLAYCSGSPDTPVCPGDTICGIYNDGVLPLCLPRCDPLNGGADCPNSNDVCLADPGGKGFVCILDGEDMGTYGTECQYFNSCAQGLFCADAASVPGCQGAQGCCSEFCNLDEPNTCSGIDGGQECIPWFEENNAPPGYEHVGGCGIP